MKDFVDGTAFNNEQGNRARKLFAAVVLAALDDAIADDKKYGNGPEQIARWARSRDGREVLSCAGIDPNERVVEGLMDFVGKGVRCNAIAPATVESPSLQDRINAEDDPVQAKKDFIARQPMGRLGTAEEIATLAVYLASDESEFVTGIAHAIDGGMSI